MKSILAFFNPRIVSIIMVMLISIATAFGQVFDKNPLKEITNDGYNMIVEKFVKIPKDFGGNPRINTFTYVGDRIFVATEIGGKIYEIIRVENTYQPVLFLDVANAILQKTGRYMDNAGGDFNAQHSGLRSVAFHPDFTTNGKFYTSLMEQRPSSSTGHKYISDVPDHLTSDGVVIEWTYDLVEKTVKSNSYREVFRVGMPVSDHTIKEIKFNRYAKPEDEDYGLLYITHGDGSEQSAVAGGGQNNDARGKVLRINPLQSGADPYSIPTTNPFVTDDNWLDEIYSLGHRNPHTICFAKDDDEKVHIIVGEVGRDNIEEVNVIEKGGDYGWPDREGTYVHRGENGGGIETGIEALPDNDVLKDYTYPAAQWLHTGSFGEGYVGQAIAGGYVYTTDVGEKLYLCSDFAIPGKVYHIKLQDLSSAVTKLDPDNADLDNPRNLSQAHIGIMNVFFDHDNNLNTGVHLKTSMKDVVDDELDYDKKTEAKRGARADLRFGQDKDENVYIMCKRNGWVYKIQSISLEEPVIIAGVNQQESQISFSAYPNPVSKEEILNLSFYTVLKKPADVYAVDITGRKTLLGSLTPGQKAINFDLSEHHLLNGYYIIHIYSNDTHVAYPVIIK